MWVQVGSKMAKKGCFQTSHINISPVFPKNKVLNSQSPNTLKDELTDLHKILQKSIFTETNLATAKRNLPSESLTVIHGNGRAKLQ